MAEAKGGAGGPRRPLFPKERSSDGNPIPTVLLIILAAVFVLPYIVQQFAPQRPAPPPPAQPAAQPRPAEPAPPPVPAKVAAAPPVAAGKEVTFDIDTSLYHLRLSNRGAVVQSWVLKKHKNSAGKPLELVNATAAQKAGYPFALLFKDRQPSTDPNQALFVARPAPDKLGIDFEFSDGASVVRKSFRFRRDEYLSQFSSEVMQAGAGLAHLVAWRGGFGDFAVLSPAASQGSLYFDVPGGKLLTKDVKAAKNGPVTDYGTYSFAGLHDNYFAAVLLPAAGTPLEVRTLSDWVPSPRDPKKEEPHVGAAVGGGWRQQFRLFVGPKDVRLLRTIDPRLEQMVDWGWFGLLAKPLFWLLNLVSDGFLHNYGWSIMVVTIFINFALLPLKLKSMKSMKRMQALQPEIAAIQAKYKGLSMRDPRKAEQNQETMGLYKKHGVNPMGGCLPMLLQIPFFFAFYKVLMVAIEMRGAEWLWVRDLSQPEHLPIRLLPVAMVITQFVLQKMTPTTTADPMQQKMMLFLPLVFGFMFYQFQSGLVLYWLTSNVVGIGQQWLINRTPPAVMVAPPAPAKSKFRKGGKGKR